MKTLWPIIENLCVRIGPVPNCHPHDYNSTETRKHAANIDALERNDEDAPATAVRNEPNNAANRIVANLPNGQSVVVRFCRRIVGFAPQANEWFSAGGRPLRRAACSINYIRTAPPSKIITPSSR
ncbi:hypothetical protein [Mesorhizobium sp. CO1-1-8]|uniref:hypothetical protein n=1 Tax=Mesorhizobium sp. CO1-1-8 TaxID=2876631 RepID=UPI001CD0F95B|nr:hypothetical protein [Mesorhizobium sp. CO1-1-8]MBZ9772195.1 hypothetical protein [Mesorhizobium sp. CO1-1-8]